MGALVAVGDGVLVAGDLVAVAVGLLEVELVGVLVGVEVEGDLVAVDVGTLVGVLVGVEVATDAEPDRVASMPVRAGRTRRAWQAASFALCWVAQSRSSALSPFRRSSWPSEKRPCSKRPDSVLSADTIAGVTLVDKTKRAVNSPVIGISRRTIPPTPQPRAHSLTCT